MNNQISQLNNTKWTKVSELNPGMFIAVPESLQKGAGVVWDEIAEINYIGREQVWDIEVEGTRNFVGNNIFAHNTYLNGYTGIGISSPTTKLEVFGTASASSGIFTNALNTALGNAATVSYSRFGTDTTGYSNFISAANDLLLSGDLEVNATAQFDSFVRISNTGSASLEIWGGGTDRENRFVFQSGGASHEVLSLVNDAGGRIVSITSGGFVGIGTVDPAGELDVAGTREKNIRRETASTTGEIGVLRIRLNSTGTAANNFAGVIAFNLEDDGGTDTNNVGSLGAIWEDVTAANQAAGLKFSTKPAAGSLTERMRLSSKGYLGIGTTSPATKLEVQGTASSSYLLTGNTLQVGGYSSVAYSRFGTDTTNRNLNAANDLLISGDLEVNSSAFFDGPVSISGRFEAAQYASASAYFGAAFTGISDCDAAGDTLNWDVTTGKFSCGTDTGGSVSSNSLDFDEFVDTMTLDATLTINTPAGRNIGIGATPTTRFEVQGTASASNFITIGSLQVANAGATVGYSRFGTDATSHSNFISTVGDLLLSNDVEFNATAQFDSFVRVSLNSATAFVVDDGTGNDQVFTVDTTASASNSGITVTAGPSQTGALLSLNSSSDVVLTKFSDEGGLVMNIASTSALLLRNGSGVGMFNFDTSAGIASMSGSIIMDGPNGIIEVTNRQTSPSVGFELNGVASISGDIILGAKASISTNINRNIGGSGLLAYGAICADDSLNTTDDCIDAARTAGTVYGIASSFTIDDIAENFPTLDSTIGAADLVAFDYQTKPASGGAFYESEFVKKSTTKDREKLLGAVSSKPGVLLGGWGQGNDPRATQQVAVALAGRIPVKISLENGPIKEGDILTVSSIPGMAAKAVTAGRVLGMALEPLDQVASGSFGQVLTFINPHWWNGVASGSEQTKNQSADSSASGQTGTSSVVNIIQNVVNAAVETVSNLWARGNIIAEGVKMTYYAVQNTETFKDVDIGTMVANWLTRNIELSPEADEKTRELFTGNGATAADQSKVDLAENGSYLATYGVDSTRGEITLSGSAKLENGESRIFFDYSFSSVISSETPIKVIITPTTATTGQLYVAEKSVFGFVVKQINSTADAGFDWLVIARRKGYEDKKAGNGEGEHVDMSRLGEGEGGIYKNVEIGGDGDRENISTYKDVETNAEGGNTGIINEIEASPSPTPSGTSQVSTTPEPSQTPEVGNGDISTYKNVEIEGGGNVEITETLQTSVMPEIQPTPSVIGE